MLLFLIFLKNSLLKLPQVLAFPFCKKSLLQLIFYSWSFLKLKINEFDYFLKCTPSIFHTICSALFIIWLYILVLLQIELSNDLHPVSWYFWFCTIVVAFFGPKHTYMSSKEILGPWLLSLLSVYLYQKKEMSTIYTNFYFLGWWNPQNMCAYWLKSVKRLDWQLTQISISCWFAFSTKCHFSANISRAISKHTLQTFICT